MTIQDVITFLNTVKPHSYSDMVKGWLNDVDTDIFKNILTLYKESTEEFEGYDSTTPATTELLAETPYNEMYKYYCMAQIDFYNREMTGYNNNIAQYQSVLGEYRNYINRTRTFKDPAKMIYV